MIYLKNRQFPRKYLTTIRDIREGKIKTKKPSHRQEYTEN